MDGKRSKMACWGAAALLLVLALAPAGARAAGSDNFAQAPFLHFGVSKSDQTNIFAYTTEQGEVYTDKGPGFCGTTPRAYAVRTVWYRLVGNGRELGAIADSDVETMISVFTDNPFGGDRGQVLTCRFDPSGSAVAWDSVDGASYWIQIGICATDNPTPPPAFDWCNWPAGAIPDVTFFASSAPPPYDTRANAVVLQPGVQYDNHGATRDLAETNSCNGTPYGNTVWLKWTSPTWGTAVFNLNGMPGVISIRRAGTDAVAHCGFGAAQARVVKGETLFLQVGGGNLGTLGFDEGHFSIAPSIPDPDDDNDGHVNASDCQPLNAAVNPGRPELKDDGVDQNCNPADDLNLDRDGDGSNRPADCDDADADRFPGNIEHRGDGHDENCIAGDDKARKPPTSGAFTVEGGRLQKFALNDALKGSRVVVTCRGPSCRRGRLVVAKRLKRNLKRLSLPRGIVGPLSGGTVLRVQVLNRPAWVGRRFQWRMTSASTWNFSGYCQRSRKWRRC